MSAASHTVRGTVLNVNDRDATRYMVTQMLRGASFEVLEANDGASALRAAARQPDAIVLDVRLPDIDGYEVCRRLKADTATASIPVLLTSAAFVGSEHRVEGLDAGADGYLVQPFEASELGATLRALLRVRLAEREAQRLAAEAQSLAADLREAVKVRDEFLSIASHELKTPLTTLQLQLDGMARLIAAQAAVAQGRLPSKVVTAVRQSERLATLVDNLLDVSRISAGRLNIERETVDLSALVREVVERFRPEAKRRGVPLSAALTRSLPCRVDRLRFEQVVTNLLSNALKYGNGTPVEVALEAVGRRARLSVNDRGIGVADADRERIFGRYERAVSDRHFGGLGLGLFITRQIVDAHEGSIRVQSDEATGTTFTVDLALEHQPDAPSTSHPERAFHECTATNSRH